MPGARDEGADVNERHRHRAARAARAPVDLGELGAGDVVRAVAGLESEELGGVLGLAHVRARVPNRDGGDHVLVVVQAADRAIVRHVARLEPRGGEDPARALVRDLGQVPLVVVVAERLAEPIRDLLERRHEDAPAGASARALEPVRDVRADARPVDAPVRHEGLSGGVRRVEEHALDRSAVSDMNRRHLERPAGESRHDGEPGEVRRPVEDDTERREREREEEARLDRGHDEGALRSVRVPAGDRAALEPREPRREDAGDTHGVLEPLGEGEVVPGEAPPRLLREGGREVDSPEARDERREEVGGAGREPERLARGIDRLPEARGRGERPVEGLARRERVGLRLREEASRVPGERDGGRPRGRDPALEVLVLVRVEGEPRLLLERREGALEVLGREDVRLHDRGRLVEEQNGREREPLGLLLLVPRLAYGRDRDDELVRGDLEPRARRAVHAASGRAAQLVRAELAEREARGRLARLDGRGGREDPAHGLAVLAKGQDPGATEDVLARHRLEVRLDLLRQRVRHDGEREGPALVLRRAPLRRVSLTSARGHDDDADGGLRERLLAALGERRVRAPEVRGEEFGEDARDLVRRDLALGHGRLVEGPSRPGEASRGDAGRGEVRLERVR